MNKNYTEKHSKQAVLLLGSANALAITSFVSFLKVTPEIKEIVDNPDKLKKWDSTLTITFVGQAFMTLADKLEPEEDVNPVSYAIIDELNKFIDNGYDEMTKIMGYIKTVENEFKSIEDILDNWGLAALSSFFNWDNTDPSFIALGQTKLPRIIGVYTVKNFHSWWKESH